MCVGPVRQATLNEQAFWLLLRLKSNTLCHEMAFFLWMVGGDTNHGGRVASNLAVVLPPIYGWLVSQNNPLSLYVL